MPWDTRLPRPLCRTVLPVLVAGLVLAAAGSPERRDTARPPAVSHDAGAADGGSDGLPSAEIAPGHDDPSCPPSRGDAVPIHWLPHWPYPWPHPWPLAGVPPWRPLLLIAAGGAEGDGWEDAEGDPHALAVDPACPAGLRHVGWVQAPGEDVTTEPFVWQPFLQDAARVGGWPSATWFGGAGTGGGSHDGDGAAGTDRPGTGDDMGDRDDGVAQEKPGLLDTPVLLLAAPLPPTGRTGGLIAEPTSMALLGGALVAFRLMRGPRRRPPC